MCSSGVTGALPAVMVYDGMWIRLIIVTLESANSKTLIKVPVLLIKDANLKTYAVHAWISMR